MPTPAPQSLTMLRGVAAVSSTDVWAVGLTFDPTRQDYAALTQNWDGTQWNVVPPASTPGENYLTGVTAAPSTGDIWAAGWYPKYQQTPLNSLMEARCGTVAAGAGGQKTGAPAAPTAGMGAPSRASGPSAVEAARARAAAAAARRAAERRAPAPNVTAVDMAGPAGLAETTQTFGGAAADLNNDGWPDFFEGHHLAQSQLFQNNNGVFTEIDKGTFPGYPDDRHQCVWIDVNNDGGLDLFCVQGGERGTIAHHNDLLIQNPDHTFSLKTGKWGLLDPYGRGVNVAALDVNLDRNMDLFLSNDTLREDGMPGTNRLYLNSGNSTTGFSAAPSMGVDTEVSHSSIGATRGCAQGGDFTGDGWPDLMVCSGYKLGVLLYQNNGGTSFTDVSAQMKAPGGNVRHAILADMNGDGVLDLVYIYSNKLVVALQQNGVFQTSFSTTTGLTDAARIAVGDVNGDGVPDIYLLQGALDTSNPPDSLYVNNGSGTSFTSLSIPETTLGAGDDVVSIDYDRNGLTDFVVLNGWHSHPGPIQLIAFFPAGSAQLRSAQQAAATWAASHGPGRVPPQPNPPGEDGE